MLQGAESLMPFHDNPASAEGGTLCSAATPRSTHSRKSVSLDEQREEIQRLRALAAQAQVEKWRSDATKLLNPRAAFCSLLVESYRHETATIKSGGGSRPYILSDPELLLEDIRVSYRSLLRDAHRLFDELEARVRCGAEHRVSATDAIASFSALYPWSDGVGCRDLLAHHRYFMVLASHRLITAGASGVITMTGFAAAQAIAEVKSEASVKARLSRLEAYEAERKAASTRAIEDDEALHTLGTQAHVDDQEQADNVLYHRDATGADSARCDFDSERESEMGVADREQPPTCFSSKLPDGRSKRASRRHRRGKATVSH